ncbi:MAG: SurA N-terminal domain-containing protein [Terriglobia bacterium]
MGLSLAVSIYGGFSATMAAQSETLDSVVASVDNIAITRSDVENAYRFELFLNSKVSETSPDRATMELVRDRQINQLLLLREADVEGIPAADPPHTAAEELAAIRRKFGSEESFQSALRSLGLSEQNVIERLHDRQRILRLIDQRLRPSAQVEPADIKTYYQKTFVPELTRRGTVPAPPLAEVEGQIREILTQKKIDQLLTSWLENLKRSHRVTVQPF